MSCLKNFSSDVEQYSIDEAFFDITSLSGIDDYEKFGKEIKIKVKFWFVILIIIFSLFSFFIDDS